jgi:uncharacterized tellurite resistance protein B-like protein
MLGLLKEMFFGITGTENKNIVDEDTKLQIATCALLLEVANADDEFLPEEKAKIVEIMNDLFGLERNVIEELISLSEAERKESVSLYEFTNIINSSFTEDQKFEILKNIWRLILVDNNFDAHEDQIIKKIGGNLHIYMPEIVKAKLIVKEELNTK